MSNNQLIASPSQGPGVIAEVDPLYQNLRATLRPLDYTRGNTPGGNSLGAYSVGLQSGVIAAAPLGAGSVISSIRWAPANANALCVLQRIKVGLGVHAALTQANAFDMEALIARSFTADYSSNNTQVSMLVQNGALRSSMPNSQLTTKGPQICTTAGMTGATNTLDANAFAVTALSVGGTTVGIGDMRTLYEYTAPTQHPVILSNNMGIVLQNISAGPSAGTFYYYVQYEWSEVFVF
jgi:hypothetical protein